MTEKCSGLAGLLGGHRFAPRYDTVVTDREEDDEDGLVTHVWRVRSQKTYIRDVCERCGASRKHEEAVKQATGED